MGHELDRIIHAFAEADPDAKIFMAKFDIKDGFWRLNCAEGEEWNFAYVLPKREGEPLKLVVPYFCAASEMARDVAGWYAGETLFSFILSTNARTSWSATFEPRVASRSVQLTVGLLSLNTAA